MKALMRATNDFPTVDRGPRTWVDLLTVRGAVGRASRRAPLSDKCNLRYQVLQPVRYAKR
jgi:hypothetical protein